MRGPVYAIVALFSVAWALPLWAQSARTPVADPSADDLAGTPPALDSTAIAADSVLAEYDSLRARRSDNIAPHIEYDPPTFKHDSYFLGYSSIFSSSSSATRSNLPGQMGLEGNGLSDVLPGVSFRRNGVPYQPGEFSWLGGDGQGLGIGADGKSWEAEALGFPPWGAHDPVLMPGPSDSVFVVPVPLLGYAPARLEHWRDADIPDSAQAVAHHTNGPDGYSYTGGRFRARAGARGAFDGQVYRVFSDGTIGDAKFDGHNLDVELRKLVGRYPARVRFRQNRGTRSNSFRWQQSADRASHKYLLSHFDAEVAMPTSGGEWLLGWHIRHEDQRLTAATVLASPQEWLARRYSLNVSRLWQATASGWLSATGRWWDGHTGSNTSTRQDLDISGGIRLPFRAIDFTLTSGIRTIRDQSAEARVTAAAAWTLGRSNRILAFAGFSKQHPSDLRKWLPVTSGVGGFSETGNPGLDITRHQTASVSWQHRRRGITLDAMVTAGESRDLAVWEPAGELASNLLPYMPVARTRTYSGAGAVLVLRPWKWLHLGGSIDHVISNRLSGAESPVFAAADTWTASARVPLQFNEGRLNITPRVDLRGALGGSLPEDYSVMSTGVDVRIKQLLFFYHRENLLDLQYRTGGAEYAYLRHVRYGFRWEFWN